MFKILSRHSEAVVSKNKQAVVTKIIYLHISSVGIVSILEQFAKCCRYTSNLLAPEHVYCSGSYAEFRHYRFPRKYDDWEKCSLKPLPNTSARRTGTAFPI